MDTTTSQGTWLRGSETVLMLSKVFKPRWWWLSAIMTAGLSAALIVIPSGAAYADETRDKQWMVDFLALKEAWNTTKGEGITVGIIDTGVDAEHPDIKDNVEGGKSISGETDDGLEDPVGHGTATASLIAGHGHGDGNDSGIIGIAPEAKILSAEVQVDDSTKSSSSNIAAGVEWLADNGADIIAIGMGHVGTNDTEHEAIKYAAIERGIPIVASAGNVGDKAGPNEEELPRTEIRYPAGYEEVVGVSAVDKSGKLADVSMYGPQVAVAAPGSSDVIAAKPGGGTDGFGGTSAAQAITAGVMALLKAKYPDETRMELTWRLTELTTEAGKDGPDDKYGFGIVNPVKALTQEPGPLPENLKDPEPTGTYPDNTASTNDEKAAVNSSDGDSGIVWIIAIAAAVAVAAIITLILLIRRLKRKQSSVPFAR